MRSITRIVIITFLSFGSFYFIDELFFKEIRNFFFQLLGQLGLSHIIAYIIVGIPIFAGTVIMHGLKGSIESLGLNKSILHGSFIPLMFTLPMLAGYAVIFQFNDDVSLNDFFIGVLSAAFFEELYFRGFLFGQLYRYTVIGFIPSVLFGALLFAAGHLYQSRDFSTLAGIFATTFMGAVFFAWLYAEWRFNLWIPVFLHLFMNLAWLLFSVSDNAFGNIYANVFRIATIVLAISVTIIYKRKRNIPIEITRQTIWMKSEYRN